MQKDYNQLKSHALEVLKRVMKEIENDTYNLDNIPTEYSPSGDGFGEDNIYINFGDFNNSMDISELFRTLQWMKFLKKCKFKQGQTVEVIINQTRYSGEIHNIPTTNKNELFYGVYFRYNNETRLRDFSEQMLLKWGNKPAPAEMEQEVIHGEE